MNSIKRNKFLAFWFGFYETNFLIDLIVTFFVLTFFPQLSEGNPSINGYIEIFGLTGGLFIYCLQETFIVIALVVSVNYLVFKLRENYNLKNETKNERIETSHLIITKLFLPYLLIASGIVHLFGTLAWILVISFGSANSSGLMSFLIYLTLFCCLIQSVFVLTKKNIN